MSCRYCGGETCGGSGGGPSMCEGPSQEVQHADVGPDPDGVTRKALVEFRELCQLSERMVTMYCPSLGERIRTALARYPLPTEK